MSNKNSLANKKRKRIKFDATSGSISGYLLSGSDGSQINNSSDNSLDEPEVFEKLKPLKARLSHEFDDSFDLFTSKKLLKKDSDETASSKMTSPCKNSNGSSPSKHFISGKSPSKNLISESKPSKNSNLGSPKGKNRGKQKTVKKCDYFDQSLTIPCPFCFKFEGEILTHISTNCIKPSCISDGVASQLIEIHTKYWNERRSLGIPDGTYNEAEVFKANVSQARKVPEANSDSSKECKVPVLKWTSKTRKSKYLLLRQSQSERENKITQKLAIVLMGSETESMSQPTEDLFLTIDKGISSDLLSSLLGKELTFWKKSSLGPDEACEEVYYIEALAPFIAPKTKTTSCSASASSANLDQGKDELEIVNALDPKNEKEVANDSKEPDLPWKESGSIHNSLLKDSFFTETEFSQSSINNCKRKHKNLDCFQETLSRNWEKMFNSSDLSDMTVLFCDGHFLGHSLVFYTYSMKIFRSISSSSDEESEKLLDWKDITSVVGKAFIKYIYCGITDHFNSLDCTDLEAILCMCNKYDEVYLEALIADLMLSKKSLEESNDKCYSKRNLTSPDIFEDIDSGNELNFDCKINVNSETVSNFNVSKRKLELSPEYSQGNDSNKRIKSISPVQCDDNFISNTILDENGSSLKCKNSVSDCNQDEVISVSSEDKGSVCSGATMSPGRYEKLSGRPLSQCSTLPPLLESPKTDDKPESLPSPPMFPDSPVEEFFEKSDKIKEQEGLLDSIEGKEECVDNYDQVCDNNHYCDNDFFDYNNYISSPWPDNAPEDMNFDSDQLEKETVNHSTKNSIDKYFDDSLPAELLLDNPEVLCKTPQSVNKSIKGSPLYKSTPTGPTSSTTNNTTTPSPHILISDKATPMLNYSNIVTPELKGELYKYGLKPEMERKKAKALLRYIYDSIHPVVSDSNSEDSSPLPNDNVTLLRTGMDGKIEEKCIMDSTTNHKHKQGKTDTLTESILATSDSESMKDEEDFDFDCVQEEVLSTQDSSSYLNKNKLLEAVSGFIKSDKVLFESILQYVPVWLSKFHQALKENNIKCTKIDLMDVLDELCITFRTERKVRQKKPPKR